MDTSTTIQPLVSKEFYENQINIDNLITIASNKKATLIRYDNNTIGTASILRWLFESFKGIFNLTNRTNKNYVYSLLVDTIDKVTKNPDLKITADTLEKLAKARFVPSGNRRSEPLVSKVTNLVNAQKKVEEVAAQAIIDANKLSLITSVVKSETPIPTETPAIETPVTAETPVTVKSSFFSKRSVKIITALVTTAVILGVSYAAYNYFSVKPPVVPTNSGIASLEFQKEHASIFPRDNIESLKDAAAKKLKKIAASITQTPSYSFCIGETPYSFDTERSPLLNPCK